MSLDVFLTRMGQLILSFDCVDNHVLGISSAAPAPKLWAKEAFTKSQGVSGPTIESLVTSDGLPTKLADEIRKFLVHWSVLLSHRSYFDEWIAASMTIEEQHLAYLESVGWGLEELKLVEAFVSEVPEAACATEDYCKRLNSVCRDPQKCSAWDHQQYLEYTAGDENISPFDFLSGYLDVRLAYRHIRTICTQLSRARMQEFIAFMLVVVSSTSKNNTGFLDPNVLFKVLAETRKELEQHDAWV